MVQQKLVVGKSLQRNNRQEGNSMGKKEAPARIKINKLLEGAGWRFFDDENGPANIELETSTNTIFNK